MGQGIGERGRESITDVRREQIHKEEQLQDDGQKRKLNKEHEGQEAEEQLIVENRGDKQEMER